MEGLIYGGKFAFQSLIVGSKFTVFALFFFVFKGNFCKYKPPGGLYLQGRFKGGFFALPVWGAYTWRGLFLEFYGILRKSAVLIFRQQFKAFDSNNFIMSLMFSFQNSCP